jgi:glycosyltransferase involved in cell wall biosynthesis
VSARSVLFLSHSASRNGASLLLLEFVQWLARTTDWRLEVLCVGGGPLLDEFRRVVTTRWCPRRLLPSSDATSRLARTVEGAAAIALRGLLSSRRYDLVYANTAAAWPLVDSLGRAGDAVLWHIHELPYALALSLAPARARRLLADATRVVAVSGPVREALAGRYGLARERVDVVHGFVPERGAPGSAAANVERLKGRAHFGWPQDSLVVGACGGPGWRKGSDLYLQAARQAVDAGSGRPLRFLWVGGADGAPESVQFDHDVRAMGLASCCARVATTANVDAFYAAMDLFALTSREDPFPLVMLEAAMHELPTLCFAEAGGGSEFAGAGAGLVVRYADVGQFAQAVLALAGDDAARLALGRAARHHALAHHRVQTQGPLLLASMRRCLSDAGMRPAAPQHA